MGVRDRDRTEATKSSVSTRIQKRGRVVVRRITFKSSGPSRANFSSFSVTEKKKKKKRAYTTPQDTSLPRFIAFSRFCFRQRCPRTHTHTRTNFSFRCGGGGRRRRNRRPQENWDGRAGRRFRQGEGERPRRRYTTSRKFHAHKRSAHGPALLAHAPAQAAAAPAGLECEVWHKESPKRGRRRAPLVRSGARAWVGRSASLPPLHVTSRHQMPVVLATFQAYIRGVARISAPGGQEHPSRQGRRLRRAALPNQEKSEGEIAKI